MRQHRFSSLRTAAHNPRKRLALGLHNDMDPLPSFGVSPAALSADWDVLPSRTLYHPAPVKAPAIVTAASDIQLGLESLQTLGMLVIISIIIGRTFGKNGGIQILTSTFEARVNFILWLFGAIYEYQHHQSTTLSPTVFAVLIVGLAIHQFGDELWETKSSLREICWIHTHSSLLQVASPFSQESPAPSY